MKNYDLIIIGSGSATNLLGPLIESNPKIKIAVIDKDEPGGICLTRGCIPSKIILYPAEVIRVIEEARDLGVETNFQKIDFLKIMERMRSIIGSDIDSIRHGLSSSENIDYYHETAEFIAPYTMKVGNETIKSDMIFLTIGSTAVIPNIEGLDKVGYLTSDCVFKLTKLPKSIVIVGGGYIAAEFGHFFSAMGSDVTIVGRNHRFLPEEEPEVSQLAMEEFQKHMKLVTDHEVVKVEKTEAGLKQVIARERDGIGRIEFEAEEILIASGRGPLTNILHPEKGGVEITDKGWIKVDEYLQTTSPNVWAFGDAQGRFLFRHMANYESEVAYLNAILKRKVKVDYHAVPHAVFTYPEIASVGLLEKEAIEKIGKDNVLIGYYLYENTAKGEAMNVKDYFVKVIVDGKNDQILGASIIGPQASVLIQEIINVMYTPSRSMEVLQEAIHIHPALNEVVQRAFMSLMPVDHYHEHVLEQ